MPLNETNQRGLRELYRALDNRVLMPDDAYYVEAVNQQPKDAVDELAREIDWQEGGGVCLITG